MDTVICETSNFEQMLLRLDPPTPSFDPEMSVKEACERIIAIYKAGGRIFMSSAWQVKFGFAQDGEIVTHIDLTGPEQSMAFLQRLVQQIWAGIELDTLVDIYRHIELFSEPPKLQIYTPASS